MNFGYCNSGIRGRLAEPPHLVNSPAGMTGNNFMAKGLIMSKKKSFPKTVFVYRNGEQGFAPNAMLTTGEAE